MRIGRSVRMMTDTNRANPFTEDATKRRFMISIYYPSVDSASLDHEPVYPELFDPGLEIAAEFFKNMGVDFSYLNTLKTNVHLNARIASEALYPVIIYSPAFGIERDMYWFNVSNLVINGFIVLTVGATFDSVFTVFPDGGHAPQLKPLADLQNDDFVEWDKLTDVRTRDIHYVLHALNELNTTDPLLQNKLDVQRIGLIGHSLGGAAVFRSLNNNGLIKAGILADPSLHLLGSGISRVTTPVMLMRQHSSTYEMLINDGWNEVMARRTMEGQQYLARVLEGYKSFIKVNGANHITFSDVPIHFNEADIAIRHQVINTAIISFFNEFVLEQKGAYTKTIDQLPGTEPIDGMV